MHFVEDVDLVTRADRCIADGVIDLAYVVDAVMRSGVHLDDIDMPALHDGLAVHADAGHCDGRAGYGTVGKLEVQSAGKDAGSRGLAHAAHAGEDPGLRNAGGVERIRDRPHHGILPNKIIEGCRPVFACEHAVAAAGRRSTSDKETGL